MMEYEAFNAAAERRAEEMERQERRKAADAAFALRQRRIRFGFGLVLSVALIAALVVSEQVTPIVGFIGASAVSAVFGYFIK